MTERRSERINERTLVTRTYAMTSVVDSDDPSSASARGKHTTSIETPNRLTEATSSVGIQATATHFHVVIDLAVTVDGLLHHSRQWAESVRRDLL